MDEISSRLAHLLTATGCRKGDRVGILMPKSIGAIAAFLGVLKAGCIYVPMDTASPASRLGKIVAVCEPRCILAAEPAEALLPALLDTPGVPDAILVGWLSKREPAETRVRHAFCWDDLDAAPYDAPPVKIEGGDPAHILFTSGSTGIPKGVVISHAGAMHFIEWAASYFGIDASDRIACHASLQFDLSTFDIFGAFFAGAQLHLLPRHVSLLPHKVAEFIRSERLTQWLSVPSVLKYMAQFDVVSPGDFPSLKRLLWAGEVLPTPVLMYWIERLPHVTFTNLYGPTETTIASSYYTVPSRPEDPMAEIPIGRACAGEQLLVLDECLQPVRTGEVGELFIGGVGLSSGYWNDPQRTASVFRHHAGFGRIYQTGDLARVGPDGLVYLLGRADSQIKSRGYRIELGEIEAALQALGMLRECAVVAISTVGFEGTAICCAYVPAPGVEISPADLRQRLAQTLPLYMMPWHWLQFDTLPLNANGKIDRPLLRETFMSAAASGQLQEPAHSPALPFSAASGREAQA